jgi:hypothetical protein
MKDAKGHGSDAHSGGVQAVGQPQQQNSSRSKVGNLTDLIHGSHVMGSTPLGDYHAAKAAVNASRKQDLGAKRTAIASALKNHRVMVSISGDKVRVYRPDQNKEYML